MESFFKKRYNNFTHQQIFSNFLVSHSYRCFYLPQLKFQVAIGNFPPKLQSICSVFFYYGLVFPFYRTGICWYREGRTAQFDLKCIACKLLKITFLRKFKGTSCCLQNLWYLLNGSPLKGAGLFVAVVLCKIAINGVTPKHFENLDCYKLANWY